MVDIGSFDCGTIASDASGLLLREVARMTGVLQRFAECFTDHRDPELIERTVLELVSQCVYESRYKIVADCGAIDEFFVDVIPRRTPARGGWSAQLLRMMAIPVSSLFARSAGESTRP